MFNVHGKQDSILIRSVFSPTWSIDSINPNHNTSKLFCRYQQTDFKSYIWRQTMRDSQHTIEGEQQSWWNDATWFHETCHTCRKQRPYGISESINKWVNGTKQRAQNFTPIYTGNGFLKRSKGNAVKQRIFTNVSGTTKYPH